MLMSLHVQNFALIDELELRFGPGLNVLTGETGAGKSIIIDALGMALGERSSLEMIRSGAERLTVEAWFALSDAPQSTREKIAENGLPNEDDPDSLIMSRELSKSGKSRCRVNGILVPTSVLRSIGQDLVDVHGQHEHQSLLLPNTHIDLLDNWLGPDVHNLKTSIAQQFSRLMSLSRDIDQLEKESRERARNFDLYHFQQKEIANAGLSPDEEDALLAERLRLSNSEKLALAAEEAYRVLTGSTGDAITSGLTSLNRLADVDPALVPIIEQLTEASAYLEEGVSLLRRYRDHIDSDPNRLEEIHERLGVIHALKRKYGSTVSEIIDFGCELEQKIYALEDNEERELQLKKSLQEAQVKAAEVADDLSMRRREGGNRFSNAIMVELRELGMVQTQFEVSIADRDLNVRGRDSVEFLIATNPGEPLKSLAKVASGGETSRVMLAVKSVLAQSSYVPTMIFDEIDTGIGGRIGRVLADKLSSLSRISQILCITHLPQIASRPADAHFSIEKSVADGRTTVSVTTLDSVRREEEIARMLGGGNSATVLQHAREMLAAR